MTEARRCEICLLDDRKLEILVQPKLLVGELLDITASHVSLREKEYFGIWYTDSTNQKRWLRNEKKVLDHGFARNISLITLTFGIRLYVQSITHLKDASTIELFFLQASKLINQDELECDQKTVFLLAAYILQATNGDYVSESITRDDMKTLKVLPSSATENISEDECVERVAFHYKRMNGLPRGDAIVNFLSIVERLPMYGTHFFDAKDKNEVPWKLGVSHRGIGQYYTSECITAKKIYMWSRMDNLFYRDKKFSIEIRDLTRTGSNQSVNSISKYATLRARQTQSVVDTWYFTTTADAREIWAISVGYHQLLVNNKELQRFQPMRTLKDIAKELTKSTSSLATSVDSELTGSMCSNDVFWYDQEDADSVYTDFITALASKREMLEMRLKDREEELKELTRQETELTAAFRERKGSDASVGATFHFSDDVLNASASNEEIEKLTRDYEIQSQITAAAKRLALDPKAKRRVRKERRILYDKSLAKLRELESKMKKLKANQTTPSREADSPYKADELSNFTENRVENTEDQFETDFHYQPFDVQIPETISSVARRAKSFSSTGLQNDYYSTLRNNLQKFRKESAELSPGSRRMVSSRYVIGDFENSGIYSGLRDKRTNTLADQHRNIHVSNSLTQIPKLTQQYSNTASSSCDELERSSLHNIENHFEDNNHAGYDAEEIRTRIHNLNNGPVNENNHFGPSRPVQDFSKRSNSISLLGGAAWSQLSQPSMDRLAPEIVSSYTGIDVSSDLDRNDIYYLEEESILERLANDLIVENDEEREETLV